MKIMNFADWPTYKIEDSLKPVLISGWIPICSFREALHQLGFALGATVETSRDNYIEIFNPSTVVSKEIKKSNKFVGGTHKQLPFVSGVEILSHNYEIEATSKEIYNAELQQGQYEITFTEPISNPTATGATISKIATNYVIIDVSGTQEVVISGYGYKDNTILSVKNKRLELGAVKNQVKVEDCTLVNLQTANNLTTKILNYFDNRRVDEFSYLVRSDKISDFVKVESVGDTKIIGTIEKLDIDLTRGYIAKAKVTGKNEVI